MRLSSELVLGSPSQPDGESGANESKEKKKKLWRDQRFRSTETLTSIPGIEKALLAGHAFARRNIQLFQGFERVRAFAALDDLRRHADCIDTKA
jgi:hypothetical protein